MCERIGTWVNKRKEIDGWVEGKVGEGISE